MPVDLPALRADLVAEAAELLGAITPLSEAQWHLPTPAEGWSILDQIVHLAYFDDNACLSITDPERFRHETAAVRAEPGGITERVAVAFRHRSGDDVREWFRTARDALVRDTAAADPKARYPWYGPDMSLASMLTARLMETWAHGQDVCDALGVARVPTLRLRHVADIGVRAFPNSFRTQGREVPAVEVRVELAAPGGGIWAFGSDGATESIRGSALDFCLVVTQRCHVADTDLVIDGPVASEWMSIAQAFAGPPGSGRPPTTREEP